MKAPHLTRALVLEAPVRLPDGAGGFTSGWAVLGTLWAEVSPGSGTEAAAVGTALSRVLHRVTVRGAPVGSGSRPRAEQRFREGSRVFKILSVTERDPAGRFLICQTEEEVAA
jgi:head-tail adaptor